MPYDTPFFENSKVVLSLDSEEFDTPFNSKFAEKIIGGSVLQSHVRGIAGLPVAYEAHHQRLRTFHR